MKVATSFLIAFTLIYTANSQFTIEFVSDMFRNGCSLYRRNPRVLGAMKECVRSSFNSVQNEVTTRCLWKQLRKNRTNFFLDVCRNKISVNGYASQFVQCFGKNISYKSKEFEYYRGFITAKNCIQNIRKYQG